MNLCCLVVIVAGWLVCFVVFLFCLFNLCFLCWELSLVPCKNTETCSDPSCLSQFHTSCGNTTTGNCFTESHFVGMNLGTESTHAKCTVEQKIWEEAATICHIFIGPEKCHSSRIIYVLFLFTSLNSFLYPSASLLPTLKKCIHCSRTDGDQTGISHNSCPQVLHELHFITLGSSGNKVGSEEDGVAMSYMRLQAA